MKVSKINNMFSHNNSSVNNLNPIDSHIEVNSNMIASKLLKDALKTSRDLFSSTKRTEAENLLAAVVAYAKVMDIKEKHTANEQAVLTDHLMYEISQYANKYFPQQIEIQDNKAVLDSVLAVKDDFIQGFNKKVIAEKVNKLFTTLGYHDIPQEIREVICSYEPNMLFTNKKLYHSAAKRILTELFCKFGFSAQSAAVLIKYDKLNLKLLDYLDGVFNSNTKVKYTITGGLLINMVEMITEYITKQEQAGFIEFDPRRALDYGYYLDKIPEFVNLGNLTELHAHDFLLMGLFCNDFLNDKGNNYDHEFLVKNLHTIYKNAITHCPWLIGYGKRNILYSEVYTVLKKNYDFKLPLLMYHMPDMEAIRFLVLYHSYDLKKAADMVLKGKEVKIIISKKDACRYVFDQCRNWREVRGEIILRVGPEQLLNNKDLNLYQWGFICFCLKNNIIEANNDASIREHIELVKNRTKISNLDSFTRLINKAKLLMAEYQLEHKNDESKHNQYGNLFRILLYHVQA